MARSHRDYLFYIQSRSKAGYLSMTLHVIILVDWLLNPHISHESSGTEDNQYPSQRLVRNGFYRT